MDKIFSVCSLLVVLLLLASCKTSSDHKHCQTWQKAKLVGAQFTVITKWEGGCEGSREKSRDTVYLGVEKKRFSLVSQPDTRFTLSQELTRVAAISVSQPTFQQGGSCLEGEPQIVPVLLKTKERWQYVLYRMCVSNRMSENTVVLYSGKMTAPVGFTFRVVTFAKDVTSKSINDPKLVKKAFLNALNEMR